MSTTGMQGGRAGWRHGLQVGALGVCLLATACVTPAEFRKVANRVTDLERARGKGAIDDRGRVADLAAKIGQLEQTIAELEGRLEVSEHRVTQALEEARAARSDAQSASVGDGIDPGAGEGDDPAVSEELRLYREAYASWREGRSRGLC